MFQTPSAPLDAASVKETLKLLASDQAFFQRLIMVVEGWLAQEEQTLNSMACQALLDEGVKSRALCQQGRVMLARETLVYLKSYSKVR